MADSRYRSATSDQNQYTLDKIALSVFCDMGIITQDQYNSVLGDVEGQIELLNSIKDLKGKQAEEFSERFIDKIVDVDNTYNTDDEFFKLVPPSTLAKAYIRTKQRLTDTNLPNDEHDYFQRRLGKISGRIDSLINDFAMRTGYYFVDPTNIADVYSGYKEMFDAREPDLPNDSDLRTQINDNRTASEQYIQEYDEVNGISELEEKATDVKTIEKNYDEAFEKANRWNPNEGTLRSASKYKFLDQDGNAKPQFIDDTGALTDDYNPGYELNPDGELRGVIDLTRHDFALHHLKDDPVSYKTDDEIDSELNNGVLHKLFEMDTAEKIVSGCMEDPERFTDPQHFQDFINNLNTNGGEISAQGYDVALDAQVNKTAGLMGRVKQKLGKFGDKATNFFGKVFNPVRKIDKRKNDRFQGQTTKREKRIEFFVRILKGFGCAFLVSAALTTVATAAAAVAGVGLAVSVATVGILTAAVMSAIQIHKWRKAQREADKDDSVKALLKDKRMLATLGTSAIASVALVFGAAGLTTAAVALGYGALTLGAGNNSISTFKDAKSSGMGTGESIAWALANAAAVIGGGFAGRATANALIDSYNHHNPDNRIFQKEETHTEYKHEQRESHEQVYRQETLDNAERIAKMWYRDNPDLLQQRVDMVNEYNATHGTNIDPYRAVIMNADAGGMTADNMLLHNQYGPDIHSGGQHTVFGPRWAAEHGFSMNEVNAMRHMFDGNQISDTAMQAAMKADSMVSSINEVGTVTNHPFQNDMVLHPNTVDANGNPIYTTYANGASPFEVVTNIEDIVTPVDVTNLTPADVPWAMATFGNYNKKHNAKLKDRPGSKADEIEQNDPEPVPQVIPEQDMLPEHLEPKQLPEHIEPKQLPERASPDMLPEHLEPKQLPEHIEPKQLPERRKEQKYLRISRADAYDIWAKEQNILREQEKLANPKLTQSEREKIKARKKKWQQELNERKNLLGNPSQDVLDDAMYWAFRKEDLQKAKEELDKLQKRKITPNTSRYDKQEIENKTAKLIAQIAEYESEIPDESYFYDPNPVQYNKEVGKKVPTFQEGMRMLRELMNREKTRPNNVVINIDPERQ